ncbi:phage tail protein [Chitinimonas arctica]|uniref:Phage tail protein n=1 Tax=Chitinimonas arctica TaxID=2594795 RepID=A0A516S9V2_9NEIS|nr:phage tail protein [Chitinimonas arctica]QDQ24933.1 phage tail protein [Chitinimonas arctica]
MSGLLKVELDTHQFFDLLHALPPSAMQAAWRRTLRKTSTWVKAQVAKTVAQDTRVPQKVLRQRLYFFLHSRDSGKVWLGLNPLQAHRLGKSRQTRRGVSVGRHRFAGAWTMAQRAPTGPVFQRTGKARYPITEVKLDWDDPGEAAFRKVAAQVEARLLVVLRQEVNYELHKALGRIGRHGTR